MYKCICMGYLGWHSNECLNQNKDKSYLPVIETKYGFNWDNVEIERSASYKKYKVITIKTQRKILSITITPTGLIRTEIINKKENYGEIS